MGMKLVVSTPIIWMAVMKSRIFNEIVTRLCRNRFSVGSTLRRSNTFPSRPPSMRMSMPPTQRTTSAISTLGAYLQGGS